MFVQLSPCAKVESTFFFFFFFFFTHSPLVPGCCWDAMHSQICDQSQCLRNRSGEEEDSQGGSELRRNEQTKKNEHFVHCFQQRISHTSAPCFSFARAEESRARMIFHCFGSTCRVTFWYLPKQTNENWISKNTKLTEFWVVRCTHMYSPRTDQLPCRKCLYRELRKIKQEIHFSLTFWVAHSDSRRLEGPVEKPFKETNQQVAERESIFHFELLLGRQLVQIKHWQQLRVHQVAHNRHCPTKATKDLKTMTTQRKTHLFTKPPNASLIWCTLLNWNNHKQL